jgi:hypothetical protein
VPEVTPSAKPDRYEPLPGLVEIPGYLVRKIPPNARRPAGIAAAVLLVAAIVALVLSIPAITDSKNDRAAAEQRAEQERKAERKAILQAQLRPETGSGTAAAGLSGATAIETREALVEDLAATVREDAVSRVQAGELTQSVDRVECERFPRGARGENPATDLTKQTGRYSCLAITADAPRTETNESSSIGYPYRALVDFEAGRYTYCMITGRPGEGSISISGARPIDVPRSCGGAG